MKEKILKTILFFYELKIILCFKLIRAFPGYILSDFFLWISLKQREAIISSKTFSIMGYFRLPYLISEATYKSVLVEIFVNPFETFQ